MSLTFIILWRFTFLQCMPFVFISSCIQSSCTFLRMLLSGFHSVTAVGIDLPFLWDDSTTPLFLLDYFYYHVPPFLFYAWFYYSLFVHPGSPIFSMSSHLTLKLPLFYISINSTRHVLFLSFFGHYLYLEDTEGK